MSLLQEMEKHGLADCEFNRNLVKESYGTLCHISEYYNDKNNGYQHGINLYDNEDLDEPIECIWFKTESERQKFIDDENITIMKDN
jgi:hypothetical protein